MSSPSSDPNVPSFQFQDLFDAALREYGQKTGKDIATDPLAARFLDCDSCEAVLDILEEQARAFDQFRKGDWKVQLMRRLKPSVYILLELSTSDVFVEGISPVRLRRSDHPLRKFIILRTDISTSEGNICWCWSPTRSMYLFLSSVHKLDTHILKAAKGVSTSYDALIELFECFEHFLGRLRFLTEIPLSVGEILVKIMVELLKVLALATQQIKQGRFSKFVLADKFYVA